MLYIGVDPGMNGAIAIIRSEDRHLELIRFEWPVRDVALEFKQWVEDQECHAYLEDVHAMPKQGLSSTFKFGKAVGIAECLLCAFMVPFDRVTPLKWQNGMQCRSAGNKNITKKRAVELWPGHPVTHATADAILIAEYCRRMLEGRFAADKDALQRREFTITGIDSVG